MFAFNKLASNILHLHDISDSLITHNISKNYRKEKIEEQLLIYNILRKLSLKLFSLSHSLNHFIAIS